MTAKTRWTSSYNIAAWLKIKADALTQAELVLSYEDTEGKKSQRVDHGLISVQGETLLSGVVNIKSLGAIKTMSLLVASEQPLKEVNCEEMMVKRNTTEPGKAQPVDSQPVALV